MIKLLLTIFLSCFSLNIFANSQVLDFLYLEEFQDLNDDQSIATVQQIADLSSLGDIKAALQLSAGMLRAAGLDQPDAMPPATLLMDKALMENWRQAAMLLTNHGILEVAAGHRNTGHEFIDRGLQFIDAAAKPDLLFAYKAHMASGSVSLALNRRDAARQSFHRAQHLIHQVHGVHAIEQVEVLEYLSLLARLDGNLEESDTLQEFILLAAERTHGPSSPRLLQYLDRTARYFAARGNRLPVVSAGQRRPGHAFMGAKLCRWGPRFSAVPCNPGLEKWQASQLLQSQAATTLHTQRLSAYARSVELLERAIDIHEQQIGNKDLNILGTIRALASVYIEKGDLRRAEQTMQRAIDASETHALPARERMVELISMGDLLQLQGDRDADEYYLAAWALIREDTVLLEEFGQMFQAPFRLAPKRFRFRALKKIPATEPNTEAGGLFVRTAYIVSEKGRAKQVKVLESTVPYALQRDVLRQLKQARFRPKIDDGKIVSSQGHTHRFNYPMPDAPDNQAQAHTVSDFSRSEFPRQAL